MAKNHIQVGELPALIASVHQALSQAATGTKKEEAAKPEPGVPINKSVRPDHIVCLFDGKKFKSLKRHLKTSHNMTPDQYRQTFGLPPDYPIVAQAYAARRSELAKALGLGADASEAVGEGRHQASHGKEGHKVDKGLNYLCLRFELGYAQHVMNSSLLNTSGGAACQMMTPYRPTPRYQPLERSSAA